MKRVLVGAGIALIGLSPGCSQPGTSPASVASPGPAVTASATGQHLNGYVSDTAFRPMAGVRVEVLNGSDRGKLLTSDVDGRFSYTGFLNSEVSMRATKDGYVARTSSVVTGTSVDEAWVFFRLAPTAPPVAVAGDYTLSITVDSACAGFPDEFRTRSWPAQLTTHTADTLPANTQFDGRVGGGQFAPNANFFWVGVAGDYLAVSTEGEGPSIVEQVGPKTYIAYGGNAGAVIPSGSSTMISAPFTGVVEYCESKSTIAQYYDCYSNAPNAVKVQCTSEGSRLSLTRR
jgi:hypothetical protein